MTAGGTGSGPTVAVPTATPTQPVPVAGAPVEERPVPPEPFTRGWQGPSPASHPGQQVAVRPVAPVVPYAGYAPPGRPTSTPAVVAFVLGCLSMTGVAPLSLVGLVLNATSWRETSSGYRAGHGLQVAGLVMNIIGVVISVVAIGFFAMYAIFVLGLLGVTASGGLG